MQQDPAASIRRDQLSARVDAFVQRAVDEGHLRSDIPLPWARAILDQLVDTGAHRFPEIDAAQAADLVVDTFLAQDPVGSVVDYLSLRTS